MCSGPVSPPVHPPSVRPAAPTTGHGRSRSRRSRNGQPAHTHTVKVRRVSRLLFILFTYGAIIKGRGGFHHIGFLSTYHLSVRPPPSSQNRQWPQQLLCSTCPPLFHQGPRVSRPFYYLFIVLSSDNGLGGFHHVSICPLIVCPSSRPNSRVSRLFF